MRLSFYWIQNIPNHATPTELAPTENDTAHVRTASPTRPSTISILSHPLIVSHPLGIPPHKTSCITNPYLNNPHGPPTSPQTHIPKTHKPKTQNPKTQSPQPNPYPSIPLNTPPNRIHPTSPPAFPRKTVSIHTKYTTPIHRSHPQLRVLTV